VFQVPKGVTFWAYTPVYCTHRPGQPKLKASRSAASSSASAACFALESRPPAPQPPRHAARYYNNAAEMLKNEGNTAVKGEKYEEAPAEDSLRGSSVKIGAIRRRSAWPLRKDDAHKSRSANDC